MISDIFQDRDRWRDRCHELERLLVAVLKTTGPLEVPDIHYYTYELKDVEVKVDMTMTGFSRIVQVIPR